MTLRNGKEFLMIPGPTNVPDEVLRAMHRPAMDIYEGPLMETTQVCLDGLKRMFRTEGKPYIYISNGHGAWDAALTNTLSRGDKVLVLESGRFATVWGEGATVTGLDVEVMPGDWRMPVDLEALAERLSGDPDHAIKAILVVQVDTASGVLNDIPGIRRVLDAAGHPALLMVDLIASLGCVPFEMDAWGVDLALAGSQKGLMTPPGLSFIAAGPRALEAHKTADLRVNYFDWTFRDGPEHYQKYCGTPPVQMLFAFRAALDLIETEGLEAVWKRHRMLGDATRAAVEVWGEAGAIEMNILVPEARSDSVSVLRFNEGDANAVRAFARETCGVTIGGTIGELAGKGLRIGHMGHVNGVMLLGTLACLELALGRCGVPHGRGGVEAAIACISDGLNG